MKTCRPQNNNSHLTLMTTQNTTNTDLLCDVYIIERDPKIPNYLHNTILNNYHDYNCLDKLYEIMM